MAKIPFSKLGLIKNQEIKTLSWNDQNIEIKQYLPLNEKLSLISNVINNAHDSSVNFSNPIQVKVYTNLEILYAYTNINFTEKQKEDPAKLYDLMSGSGLLEMIFDAIPKAEYENLVSGINDSIAAIYSYQNSILGILDTINSDYSNLDLNAGEIQSKLADPNNMELLKSVLSKLG